MTDGDGVRWGGNEDEDGDKDDGCSERDGRSVKVGRCRSKTQEKKYG